MHFIAIVGIVPLHFVYRHNFLHIVHLNTNLNNSLDFARSFFILLRKCICPYRIVGPNFAMKLSLISRTSTQLEWR